MTKNPVTVAPETTVDDALAQLKVNKIRRLPVEEGGKLVGIITDKDLMRVMPSDATTLSRFEINDLLAKIKIKDIMAKSVISVKESAPIEEAALLMSRNRISGLPVISDDGAVVGVITETDIFDAFVDIMDLKEGKVRITLEVDNKIGVVKDISTIFTETGNNIDSFVTCPQAAGKYEIIIRGNFEDIDTLTAKLTEHGYTVIQAARIGH
jgi:acetoin utilization protein AcuB